jgi:hypothetical protein
VTAKLTVYETMRARGWSKARLAKELGMSESSVRRLLDLHHTSHMWIIDAALAKMSAELLIDLPKGAAGRKGSVGDDDEENTCGQGPEPERLVGARVPRCRASRAERSRQWTRQGCRYFISGLMRTSNRP